MATKTEQLEIAHPIKMLWFTRVLGYHLHSTRRTPIASITGNIRYKNVWVLEHEID